MSFFWRLVLVVAVAFVGIDASSAWAQTTGHVMVAPQELKWVPVASLPGAQIAVIERRDG